MRRRDFIALCGATLAAQSAGARAQSGSRPKVGFLSPVSAAALPFQTAAFLQGLKETGHAPGQNIEIEYRWVKVRPKECRCLQPSLSKRMSM